MSERARRAAAPGSMENAVGGVVRVTLQFPDDDGVGDGVVVGHLGLVKEEDPRDGLRVELLTAPSAEEHWLTDDCVRRLRSAELKLSHHWSHRSDSPGRRAGGRCAPRASRCARVLSPC